MTMTITQPLDETPSTNRGKSSGETVNGLEKKADDRDDMEEQSNAHQNNLTDIDLGDMNNSSRTCRICLQSDRQRSMIAPCRCKGTSKWIHRSCLDQWRAYNTQDDVAFSRCMECHFDYQFEAVSETNKGVKKLRTLRRVSYYWLLVSRDVVFVTVAVQCFILFFALLFWFISKDEHEQVVAWVDDSNNPVCRTSTCQFWSCYAMGLLALFLVAGLYGSYLLCLHSCNVCEAMASVQGTGTTSRSRGGGGRHTIVGDPQAQTDCCLLGCECCEACGDGCGGCGDGCCGGGGGGGDCEAGLVALVFLVLLGAVLAVIGFVLAAIVALVVVQTIVRRHLWIIQKRALAKEYRVKDLSSFGDDATALELGGGADANGNAILPSAPTLGELEMERLRRLGLAEEK